MLGTLHVNLGQKCRLKNPSGNNLVLLFIRGIHEELLRVSAENVIFSMKIRAKNEDLV